MLRRSDARSLLMMLPVLALCGCAGATNIKAVKANDYNKVPQRLLVAIPDNTILSNTNSFKKTLSDDLAKCGTTAQFMNVYNMAAAKEGHFDALIQTTPMGEETTTITAIRTGSSRSYASKLRMEFSLYDTETQKNVWKEQIDFTNDDSRGFVSRDERDATWANALFDTMKKNGLVGTCDTAHAVAMPVNLVFVPSKAAIAANTSKPTTISFTVGGVKYDTADTALAATQAEADKKVAQAAPVGLKTYEPLLVVLPTMDEIKASSIKISGVVNQDDFDRYLVGSREIQNDSYVRAFRKTTLFKTVDTVHAGDVQPDDFQGHRYKLWFAKPDGKGLGSWVVAGSKGGEQRFQLSSGDKNDVQSMLMKLQSALDDLPR